jgi:hypothetical protein
MKSNIAKELQGDQWLQVDIVKKLVDFELENTIRILVPDFPEVLNYYDAGEIVIAGYYTQEIYNAVEENKKEFLIASKLKFIRDHLINLQKELETLTHDVYVREGDDDTELLDEYLESFEKKDYKRYFQFKDTFCIRNHTTEIECFETLFPCRSCMIRNKKTFPLITTTSEVIRIH